MDEHTRQHTPERDGNASRAAPLVLAALWRALAVALALTVAVLSLIPAPPPPPAMLAWDKAQHALAYGVLAWWWLQCWPRRAGWLLVGLVAYGVALEGLQALSPQRMLEAGDMMANAVGAFAGAVALSWRRLRLVPVLDRVLTRRSWRG